MRLPTAFLLAIACGGPKDTTTDSGTDSLTTSPQPFDSAVPVEDDFTGNIGSIAVLEYVEDVSGPGGTITVGLFVSDDGGLANAAACLLFGDLCILEYPDVGASATAFGDYDWFYATDWYEADPVTVDGSEMTEYNQGGITFYVGDVPAFGPGDGAIALDGELAPYEGMADFTYPSAIEATSPDPLADVVVDPSVSATLDFAWVSGGVGDVLLETGEAVFHLDDDGAESFAFDALGLEGPLDFDLMQLTRATYSEIDAAGNTIKIQARSNQLYFVTYTEFADRTQLVGGKNAGEDCDAASLLPPVPPGLYWGNTVDADDDHSLEDYNDLFGYKSLSNDLVIPIALLAGQELAVTYRSILDGAVYLLPASCDEDDALEGADDEFNVDPEEIDYTASADETVYLVLDAYFLGGDYFALDFTVK